MARRVIVALIMLLTGLSLLASDISISLAQTRQQQWLEQRRQRQMQVNRQYQYGQQRGQQRGGVLQRLFGPRDQRNQRNPRYQVPPEPLGEPRITKKKKKPPTSDPAVEVVEVAPKDPNARKVLVIGDFVAGGLAWGLDQAFAKEPRLMVLDKAQPTSGLVRTDSYDWNAELPELLNLEKPDLVIVVFGVNDRQQMKADGTRLAIRSTGWEKVYAERIAGIAETLKVYGRPFFWVGAPPLKTAVASGDMAYLNGLYKPRAEAVAGTFIDVWNGFTNESGQFITSGPDIDGQVRALRTSDGINFTRAGRLKLSFYVEKEVRRRTGLGAGTVDLVASTTQTSTIEIGPDGKKRLVGPVISLSDPLPGASLELAGPPAPMLYDPITGKTTPAPKAAAAEAADESWRHRLVVKGEALPVVAGRADDYAWPPAERAALAPVEPVAGLPLAGPAPAAAAAASVASEPALTPASKPN